MASNLQAYLPHLFPPTTGPGSTGGTVAGKATVFFDDFNDGRGFLAAVATMKGTKFSEQADFGQWLATITATDTEVIKCADSAHGGQLTIKNGTADNDLINLQMNGESWSMSGDRDIYFEIRLHVDDIALTDWFVGLCATDTSVLAGTPDYIGFGDTAAAGDIKATNGRNDTTGEMADADGTNQELTDTGQNLVNSTFTTLAFRVEGLKKIRYYVDGTLRATHTGTADMPSDVSLTPTISIRNASGAARTMTVDYILIAADRTT